MIRRSERAATSIDIYATREGRHMRPQLRLYTGESSGPAVAEPQVSVRFGEVLTALHHAMRCNRTWLDDFEDDELHVSADLYEVISAYTHLRPSA